MRFKVIEKGKSSYFGFIIGGAALECEEFGGLGVQPQAGAHQLRTIGISFQRMECTHSAGKRSILTITPALAAPRADSLVLEEAGEDFWKHAEDLPWVRPLIRPEHQFWDPEDRKRFAMAAPEEALMTGRLWDELPSMTSLLSRPKHDWLPDHSTSYMNLKGGHSPFLGARPELQGAYDNGRRLEDALLAIPPR